MEIYNATGNTLSGEKRVTKGIGALLISSDLALSGLTTERITVFVERATGGNIKIANKVLLKDFVLASTFADGLVSGDTANAVGFEALCELASDGAIPLSGDEVIIVELTDLIALKTYRVNGIEYPQFSDTVIATERKTMSSDDSIRSYNVSHRDVVVLSAVDKLNSVSMLFSNGLRVEYTAKEIIALSNDVEGIYGYDKNGAVFSDTANSLVIPLEEVVEITIEKDAGTAMELTMFTY